MMTRKRVLITACLIAVVMGIAILASSSQQVAWADEDSEPQPAQRMRELFVRGTVTGVKGDVIEVEPAEGELRVVHISEDTRQWVPGAPPTSTIQVSTGDAVLVVGKPHLEEEGALAARLIVVADEEEMVKIVVRGEVLVTTERTLVIKTRRGEHAISVRPQTRIVMANGRRGSVADIRPGTPIVALGQPTDYGQWIGGIVWIQGAVPTRQNGLRGEVTEINAATGTLTVETTGQRGALQVITDEKTRYRIPDVQDPSLDDIEVGDRVIVLGRFEPDSEATFLAVRIGVLRPQ